MHRDCHSLAVDRGVALWKIARVLTLGTAGHGYLNFIGNEFAHPEWIDFPREGNAWSCWYARRQWSLRDNPDLKYHALGDFDAALMHLLGHPDFLRHPPEHLHSHVSGQRLAFHRSGFIILANLHPSESVRDYPVPCPAGTWELLLDTDEERFAGHTRLQAGQRFHSRSTGHGALRFWSISRPEVR
jgi:1,4-alpha-glucan branching enzyme